MQFVPYFKQVSIAGSSRSLYVTPPPLTTFSPYTASKKKTVLKLTRNFLILKMMMNSYGRKQQTVLMFPWLGHGHISPFFELAKKLSNTNRFNIYLCSTPANLDSVKKTLSNEFGSPWNIRLIELHLPTLPELPPHLHTTNGLPLHLMPTLKQAFDMASPRFSRILLNLKPDLLIYDILQPWAPVAAAALGIPSVVFITTSAAASMVHFQLNTSKNIAFPFSSTIYYRPYEDGHVSKRSVNKERDRVKECVESSSSIVLVKSFKEIEDKYANHLSLLTGKKIVPVGPLVAEPFNLDMKQNNVIEWLDTKSVGSTVFVSFGSEYFLSRVDLKEIAYGLEMSNVNFIWVLRFPKGESKISISVALPLGFLERVKGRGLVIEGWAPQARILGHKNLGGFVSHCGWNSVLEAMKFGVPIIAMPMHLDQPINARLAVAVGVGLEVVRDENGKLRREMISAVVQHVVVSKLGKVVREKAKKMGADLRLKGDQEETDVVAKELIQLYKSAKELQKMKTEAFGGGGGMMNKLQKTKSEAFAICTLGAMKGEV